MSRGFLNVLCFSNTVGSSTTQGEEPATSVPSESQGEVTATEESAPPPQQEQPKEDPKAARKTPSKVKQPKQQV